MGRERTVGHGLEADLAEVTLRADNPPTMSKRVSVKCISDKPYLTGEGFSSEGSLLNLTLGKVYEAEPDGDWWWVWADLGEDYLYPSGMFEMTA